MAAVIPAALGVSGGLGTALTVAGGALGVLGALSSAQSASAQAKSQAATAQYNAQVARNNALMASRAADQEAREIREETKRRLSSIRATQAASGVVTTAGSPLLVLEEQALEGELSAQRRLFQGQLQAQGYSQQAVLDETQSAAFASQSKSASQQGLLNAAGIGIKTGTTLLG